MLSALLCAVALGQVVLGEGPQVTTSQGTMRGQVLQSRDGRDYFSFTKIPYAKPPLGERRFMISEKAENWTGILDATQHIPFCYQIRTPWIRRDNQMSGDEDCLYLNVFTPNITGRKPVIFFIHGGGFKTGSADDYGSGKYFMDEDVVAVYTNYRLGNLGFLSFEDNVIPGNMGLKDQALALEWVHREISAFGGDPNSITVMGESAGGASSDIICSAPRTNGLIKGCITQSGDGWGPWAIRKPGEAREMSLKFAEAIGCNVTGDILKCLQSKPVEIVGNTSFLKNSSRFFKLVSPVLEPPNAPGAILTRWPTAVNQNYPRIIGVCQEDGSVKTMHFDNNLVSKEERETFIKTLNKTIISELNLQNKTNEFQRIYERFFSKGDEPIKALRNFATEYMFWHPALKALSRHPGPTYFFKFNYTGLYPKTYRIPGAGHFAEMPYLFEVSFGPGPNQPKDADIALSKMLVKMWANFARSQTPNSRGLMEWPQFQGKYFLDIQNSGVTIGEFNQYHDILDFWRSIFPDS